ncbi:hypothetical protein [Microbispora sp. NBRC 16548]|uniref:hypothetical protein n=1 Tax=Microbispora sp. NBRC 16548 TaxID=3030994 RepID=UPI0024A47360|nr:hypothetical protein [Microbispora sp. NBRC 16548]GLX06757.1 hypothetical protein Misp03_36840 [Microbispora sp. NBRC 16548]
MSIARLPLQSNGHMIPRWSEVEVLRPFGGVEPLVMGADPCAVCGRPPKFQVTEDAIRVQDPCPYPNGITSEITIDVSSGKLLVSDDLRPIYDWDDSGLADYTTALGQAQAVEAMAALGCAYGPASNCELGLYRTSPDHYIIATPGYDDDEVPSLPKSDCLASICTDLWAYSIADFEQWKKRGGDPARLDWTDTVVDVPPGTYRFIHHSGERGFDRDAAETVIWAHIERLA